MMNSKRGGMSCRADVMMCAGVALASAIMVSKLMWRGCRSRPVVWGKDSFFRLLRRIWGRQTVPGLVGVIGGMGPKATSIWFDSNVTDGQTAMFMALNEADASAQARLDAVRNASTADWTSEEIELVWESRISKGAILDQDHVELLIYSNPSIPNRPGYLLGTTDQNPAEELTRTARILIASNVSALCMVCNSAHGFVDAIIEEVPDIPFLNMVDLTVEYIVRGFSREKSSRKKKFLLGLLGTKALLRIGIYEKACYKLSKILDLDIEILSPLTLEGGYQGNFDEAVFGPHGIKAGYDSDFSCPFTRKNFERLTCEIEKLIAAGSEAIVLGCTELPLILTQESLKNHSNLSPKLLVNPAQVLADEVVRFSLIDRSKKQ